MDEREIDRALAQVRQVQELVLDRQRFRCFSGAARMAGGAAALAAALALRLWAPAEPRWHLAGWGALLAFGLAANVAGLLHGLRRLRRSPGGAELWPAFELLPGLAVGAALSWALLRAGQLDLLFGTWMALYGLAHLAFRRSLPLAVYAGGLAYVVAGIVFLLAPAPFTDPRPMGLVFGVGELYGGWCLLGAPGGAGKGGGDDGADARV